MPQLDNDHASDLRTPDIRTLVRRLDKPPADWQRRDLVRLCLDEDIRVVNFRFPSLDGKLRELRLPVNNAAYLDRILAAGERVDGSSLFPGLFATGESDLYAVPVYRWAFLNPFAEDELDIVCRFADRNGEPAAQTPDTLLAHACSSLQQDVGVELRALAELEFYLVLDRPDDRFTARSQRNYQQSAPYVHGREIVDDMLRSLSEICGAVKYGHSEVGVIDRLGSEEAELEGRRVEQYELEFDLLPMTDLGCWLTVARWLVRALAAQHGASVTFVPKLDEGMAGNGMHLHLATYRGGVNTIRGADGELSSDALRMIGGLLRRAGVLTAFGNTVAASYLRLVPGQEAPTHLSWGERDRSSLLRVPLSFDTPERLDKLFNPLETAPYPANLARPTVELRSPDGSALPLPLLAAVTTVVADALADPVAEELARRLRVRPGEAATGVPAEDVPALPVSAVEAAELLQADRAYFEQRGFEPRLLDALLAKLRAEGDGDLEERLRRLPAADRLRASRRAMHKDIHKH